MVSEPSSANTSNLLMASSSSPGALPILGTPVTEKLTRENYILWKAQVMPAIRGANLVAILDGTLQASEATVETIKDDKIKVVTPNPEHGRWVAQDQ